MNLQRLDGIHVLLVEDEVDNREVLKVLLEQFGANVTTVASGEDALLELLDHQPDVLISDISMPGMNDYELLRHIQQLNRDSLPAIAFTAHASEVATQQALTAGFQQYLVKPVEVKPLLDAIISVVERA